MADTSLNEMIAENKKRNEEYLEKAKALLLSLNPGLIWDNKKARVVSVSDVEYQDSNLSYYHVSYLYGVSLRKTDLSYAIDLKQELHIEYQLIEHGSRILVVEKPYIDGEYVSGDTHVVEYWKDNGKRINGVRSWRKLHKSSKGIYFEMKGKRVYTQWAVGQGA